MKLGLRAKIVLPIALIMVFFTAVTAVNSFYRFSGYVDSREDESIAAVAKGLQKYLAEGERKSKVAAITAAEYPEIVKAVGEGDTAEIIKILTPTLELFDITYFTVTDHTGTVLARTYEPEKFGDSVTNQHNIVDALNGNVSTYTESGTLVKVSIRTGAPVYDTDGTLIGVISAGVRLDKIEELESLKAQFNADFGVFFDDTWVVSTLTDGGEQASNPDTGVLVAEKVIAEKEEYYERVEIMGKQYIAYYLPLFNTDNEVFAILFAGTAPVALISTDNGLVVSGVFISLTGFAISLIALMFIVKRILRPLRHIPQLVSDITNGNMDVTIGSEYVANDETGPLVLNIYSLINTVKSILVDISSLTRELSTSDDIKYQIDTDKYSGAYKEIIDGIKILGDSLHKKNRGLREALAVAEKNTVSAHEALKQMVSAQEAHKRANSMLDSAPFGCVIWDQDLNVTYCNKKVVNLFELKNEQEFITKFNRLSPEYQPDGSHSAEKSRMFVEKTFQTGRQVFEWIHQLSDGTPLPAEITLVRINYGGDTAVASYIRDLRQYKQMAEEIDHRNNLVKIGIFTAEMLFATELEQNDGIENILMCSMAYLGRSIDVDRVQIWRNETVDGSLHFVHAYQWLSEVGEQKAIVPIGMNFPYSEKPEWENMFMRGEHINGPLSEMSSEDQAFLNAYQIKTIVIIPLFLQNQFWGFFSVDDCKLERTFTTEEINILRSISLMMANVFLRNQMSEELQNALDDANAANKAKSDFLSKMSHEIRTPMNAVIGMTELLQHESLNKTQKSYVDDIHTSARSLLSLINDILDMSKIEAGKFELSPVHYDFHAFLDNVASMFRFVAEKKNIEFQIKNCQGLPEYVYGDDIRLRQILTNICGNAVKFTEKGYVRLTVAKVGEFLQFEITDTGMGIKKEDIDKLFGIFGQVDTKKNRNIVGTGLGLAISKAFVEMMGGSIVVDSIYGQGTIFTVTIPLVEGDKEESSQKVMDSQAASLTAADAKILVVDDNEFNLKVAKGLLNLSRIDAQTAPSGEEALVMIQQNDYDIVFMDHMMPGMDGVETTGKIRELGYGALPIIALTANAVQGAREMFLANGFNGFLSKPIDLRELNEILKQWLPADKVELEETGAEEAKSDENSVKLGMIGKIKEINVEIGLIRTSGIEKMYIDAVAFFFKKLKMECGGMTGYLDGGDLKGFEISVHAMKSTLATIGAMKLSEMAANLETAAGGNELDYCLEEYPKLREKLLALHEELAEVFPAEDAAGNKEKGDIGFLRENIQKALSGADDFDGEAAVEAIRELLAFDFGVKTGAVLEKALSAFDDFDFSGGREALDEISELNNSENG